MDNIRLPYSSIFCKIFHIGWINPCQKKKLETRKICQYGSKYISQQYREKKSSLLVSDAAEDLVSKLAKFPGKLRLILGDYGCGKTTLLRRAHDLIIETYPNLFPVYLSLKEWNTEKLNKLIHERLGLTKKPKNVIYLLDGFDEISNTKNNILEQEIHCYFDQILDLLTTDDQVVVTARTHYFESDNIISQAIQNPLALRSINLYDEFEIFYLLDFDQNGVKEYVYNYIEEHKKNYSANEFLNWARTAHGLSDLLTRPIILEMMLFIYSENKHRLKNKNIDVLYIFQTYVKHWFRFQSTRGSELLVSENRLSFCKEMAWYLFISSSSYLPASEIRNLIEKVGISHNSIKDIDVASTTVRTVTLIVRDPDGKYSFSHKSFFDYFLAEYIYSNLDYSISDTKKSTNLLCIRSFDENTMIFLSLLISKLSLDKIIKIAFFCLDTNNELASANIARTLTYLEASCLKIIIENFSSVEVSRFDHECAKNIVWAFGNSAKNSNNIKTKEAVENLLIKVFNSVSDEYVLWNCAFALEKLNSCISPLELLSKKIKIYNNVSTIIQEANNRVKFVVSTLSYGFQNPKDPEWKLLIELIMKNITKNITDKLNARFKDQPNEIHVTYNCIWILGEVMKQNMLRHFPELAEESHLILKDLSQNYLLLHMLHSCAVEALAKCSRQSDLDVFKQLINKSVDIYFRSKIHALEAINKLEGERAKEYFKSVKPLQFERSIVEWLDHKIG